MAKRIIKKGQHDSHHSEIGQQVLQLMIDHYRVNSEQQSLAAFIQTLWQNWPVSDVPNRELIDHAHSLYSVWLSYGNACTINKLTDQPLIKIKSPNIEEEGWSCHCSVLHLVWPDCPFLVDTLRMTLNTLGIGLRLLNSTVFAAKEKKASDLAVVYAELGLLTEQESDELKTKLRTALFELKQVVSDYPKLLAKSQELQKQFSVQEGADAADAKEVAAFLQWLEASNFTYLGYREFTYKNSGKVRYKEQVKARLGICGFPDQPDVGNMALASCIGDICDDILIFTKSHVLARVHRAIYPDCIVIKLMDKQGEVIGEGHLLGFFTYAVGHCSPASIPWVRKKLAIVNKNSGLVKKTYAHRSLQRVIEGFPRDELFQASVAELNTTLLGVNALNERKQVRLFLRASAYGRFVSAIVYVPRDVYSTRVREKVEEILSAALGSEGVESTTFFSESVLARAYSVFKLPENNHINIEQDIDVCELQNQINTIATGWLERLESALIEAKGDKQGLPLYRRYSKLLSVAYQDAYDARAAVGDINLFENAVASRDIAMQVFKPQGNGEDRLRFKVVNASGALALSDIIPILENLGVRVLGENPYCVTNNDDEDQSLWLHDFSLQMLHANIQTMDGPFKRRFSEAFYAAWHEKIDNDSFNRLVLAAEIPWRDVTVLRAYANYFKQTLFSLDLELISQALLNNAAIACMLVKWFYLRFDPTQSQQRNEQCEAIETSLNNALDDVSSLDEDRVFRRYIDVIKATLRTNFFQDEGSRACADTLVFKLAPHRMEEIPSPKPQFEIFVYSTRIEGVHLRTSQVARGGLRWSDRLSDYRTEVLGLVKAQAVKNAVIVPSGAKGGFVAKKLHRCCDRQSFLAEGVACYQNFIRGLLSVTDNLQEGETVKPEHVVCHDDDDPYLVVAADKGTATFSDIANEISLEYGHWLGDGFASGGSQGYDHKAMGITAKGAWVSVQRHFREKGVDVQTESISVVGVGDMAGDVFGNGMLLSEKIKLMAAFNHLHIFIDPDPNPEITYAERLRLFNTPGCTWKDFDKSLIAKGGGVFERSAKSIAITPQMKAAFDLSADKLTPNQLIHELLKSPVDLIWNGGIGTYVKGSRESHADVGDKANDGLRVNGSELRCQVFGEGGNLGMTQRGRVEFCQHGGACNTDFIDNAAGVDCSDHEVNLKILLQGVIERGDLTEKQRNDLLREYTDAVSDMVLEHNFAQTECLSLAEHQSRKRASEYRKLISYLEQHGGLDRCLEFLPEDHELVEAYAKDSYLTRPELAVLLSYTKVMLKESLQGSPLPEDEAVRKLAFLAFPAEAGERFANDVHDHRLLNEIVGTQLANDFINNLGITAAYRFLSSSNNSLDEVLKAYVIAREVFSLPDFNAYLKTLCNQLPESELYRLKNKMARRVRRGVRWFLRNGSTTVSTQDTISTIKPMINRVAQTIEQAIVGELKASWQQHQQAYLDKGIDSHWAMVLAMPDNLFSGLGVAAIERDTHASTALCTRIFYGLHNHLNIRAFAGAVSDMPVHSPWQAMSRETLLEDIEIQLRIMAESLVDKITLDDDIAERLTALLPNTCVVSWLDWLKGLDAEKEYEDISLYHVTLRQLATLSDTTTSH